MPPSPRSSPTSRWPARIAAKGRWIGGREGRPCGPPAAETRTISISPSSSRPIGSAPPRCGRFWGKRNLVSSLWLGIISGDGRAETTSFPLEAELGVVPDEGAVEIGQLIKIVNARENARSAPSPRGYAALVSLPPGVSPHPGGTRQQPRPCFSRSTAKYNRGSTFLCVGGFLTPRPSGLCSIRGNRYVERIREASEVATAPETWSAAGDGRPR